MYWEFSYTFILHFASPYAVMNARKRKHDKIEALPSLVPAGAVDGNLPCPVPHKRMRLAYFNADSMVSLTCVL